MRQAAAASFSRPTVPAAAATDYMYLCCCPLPPDRGGFVNPSKGQKREKPEKRYNFLLMYEEIYWFYMNNSTMIEGRKSELEWGFLHQSAKGPERVFFLQFFRVARSASDVESFLDRLLTNFVCHEEPQGECSTKILQGSANSKRWRI